MPTTTPFSNLITFSRGSNATVTGSNGLIQWAPANLLTFSEQFDNAAWVTASITISANAAVAPDGTSTADLVYPTTTGTARRFTRSGIPGGISGIYTNSLYLKFSGIRWVYMFDNTGSAIAAWFDVQNGVVGTVAAGYTATITAVGNGWYRCALTNTSAGVPSFRNYIGLSDANNSEAVTANATAGVLFWGAQAELGSTATTYNSTTVKNLLGFSEAFDNAAWTKSNVGIVTGAAANPVNGLFNAQKLMEDTATTSHQTFQVTTVISGTSYTFSVYAKQAVGSRTLTLRCQLTPVNFQGATFDLATGASSQLGTGITASASAVGNGWYRCSITFTASASGGNLCYVNTTASGTVTYTGDGNSGIFIYGAQLSDSASLDPYVPTPGAAPSSTAFYGPRFDFDPVTRQPRGILIEEARTNLLTYSEQFDNAAWIKSRSTITANATTSPDGTADADKLVEDTTATSTHRVYQQAAKAASSLTRTFSVYLKAAERTFSRVVVSDNTEAVIARTDVDLSQGTATAAVIGGGSTISAASSSIAPAGSGWYRVTITATFDATITNPGAFVFICDSLGGITYTGNGTSGIFAWGAQWEDGAFATSYIPTIASTVTRSADVATITGSLFSQWYRQDQGAFVVDASYGTNAGWAATFEVGAGTTRMQGIRRQISSTAASYVLPDGSTAIAGGVWANNTTAKLAGASASSNHSLVLNGAVVGTNTSVAMNNPTGLSIGRNFTGAEYFNGHIRSIDFIPFRSADFQLQNVTRQPPWNVLAANGTLYNIGGYSARTADGTAYAVPQTVLSSTGISYNVI